MLNQPLLALPPPPVVRARSVRRPFHPSETAGRYRLPQAVQARLSVALSPFRNRDAAWLLATFLGRFWAVPARLVLAFPIDRRALADRADLGLTENQVRGAIATLEAVGFLDRDPAPGSRYKPTADGLRCRPILFRFGAADFLPAFLAANARAEAGRGAQPTRRALGHQLSPRQPMALIKAPLAAPTPRSPEDREAPEKELLMGEVARGYPRERMAEPTAPSSPLEAALARLGRALLNPGAKPGERS